MRLDHLQIEVSNKISALIGRNLGGYKPTDNVTSNEEQSFRADVHDTLVELAIAQTMKSVATKLHDNAKKKLDHLIVDSVKPGTQETLYEDSQIRYTKKKNNDSVSVPVKDFILELQKQGVEQSIIDKAYDKAVTTKKGNTYYVVEDR